MNKVKKMKEILLGLPEVDIIRAITQATESSLDVLSTVKEFIDNAKDFGAKNIRVDVEGDKVFKNSNSLYPTKITVYDDGSGMKLDDFMVRYRGVYQDSESHESPNKAGRNCVGTKSLFQYFKEVKVSTTTKGYIPKKDEWDCPEKMRNNIQETHDKCSKLKPGSKDTEVRRFTAWIHNAKCEKWESCKSDESWTKIEMLNPINKVELSIKTLIQHLSKSISFLSDGGKISLSYKINGNNRSKEINIRPFVGYKRRNFVCKITGWSNNDLPIIIQEEKDGKTRPATIIPAKPPSELSPVYLDVQVSALGDDEIKDTYRKKNMFVMSVCGVNVYDSTRNDSVSGAINYIVSKSGRFRNLGGFCHRVDGYISSESSELKKALRLNKTQLDQEVPDVQKLDQYLTDVFLNINKIYIDSQEYSSKIETREIEKAVQNEIRGTMVSHENHARRNSPSGEQSKVQASEIKCSMFVCNSCHETWKTKRSRVPSKCCEFSIDKRVGCGSGLIERFRQKKVIGGLTDINVKILPSASGKFIPAWYDANTNTVICNEIHPVFLIPMKNNKKNCAYKVTIYVAQIFTALAIWKSKEESREFEIVYGEYLRCWYDNRVNGDELKKIFKERLKESNASIEDI